MVNGYLFKLRLIASGGQGQRTIDGVSLSMLGLDGWVGRLDDLYDAILCELDAMQGVLEQSRRGIKDSTQGNQGGRRTLGPVF